jgi:UDP:flavonoid glycosyltransferase YjiC (YdhE family)
LPDAPGPRAFVYLKDARAAEAALGALAEASVPTVAYVENLPAEARRKLESPTTHLSPRPLDLRRAAAECDLAVLGGGHGATIEMLLAGKPVLEIPAAREQRMVADAVARLGAGEVAQPKRPDDIRQKLALMLGSDDYRDAARRFARRYQSFDPRRQRAAMLSRCDSLLPARLAQPAFA